MNEIFQRNAAGGLIGLPTSGSLAFDAGHIDWQDCGTDGFLIKPLLEDETSGIRTWLMKVEAGAYSEPHAHDEIEQIYVLDGTFFDQDKTYGAGEFVVRAAGAMHSAGSKDGALILLFYSPPCA